MFQIKLKKLLGKNGGDGAQVGPASPKPPPFGFGWQDGYQYPTLFEEADEMLQASLLVYSITDLRSLARDPKKKTGLKSPEKILEMPLTLHTCLEMIEENIDAIEKEFGDVHADTMSTLRMIHERYERTAGGTGAVGSPARQWFNPFASDDGSVEVQTVAPALTSFGDENPDSDMVYCVGVDPIRKRVTVAFRGYVRASLCASLQSLDLCRTGRALCPSHIDSFFKQTIKIVCYADTTSSFVLYFMKGRSHNLTL